MPKKKIDEKKYYITLSSIVAIVAIAGLILMFTRGPAAGISLEGDLAGQAGSIIPLPVLRLEQECCDLLDLINEGELDFILSLENHDLTNWQDIYDFRADVRILLGNMDDFLLGKCKDFCNVKYKEELKSLYNYLKILRSNRGGTGFEDILTARINPYSSPEAPMTSADRAWLFNIQKDNVVKIAKRIRSLVPHMKEECCKSRTSIKGLTPEGIFPLDSDDGDNGGSGDEEEPLLTTTESGVIGGETPGDGEGGFLDTTTTETNEGRVIGGETPGEAEPIPSPEDIIGPETEPDYDT